MIHGKTYTMEAAEALTGPWVPADSAISFESTRTLMSTNMAPTRQFYRVRVDQSAPE